MAYEPPAEWETKDMKWNSSLYEQKHSFVFKYGEEVLALLNPQRGERILDVGCGTGHLTKLIAEAGAEVVGIDSSPEMVEAARVACPDINFVVADAADFSFTEPFDAVFSNAALHWVTEAKQAMVCMAQSLKQGGRFVVELGGKGNLTAITGLLEKPSGRCCKSRLRTLVTTLASPNIRAWSSGTASW